ncbi:MAG: DEAD/DEAH box helicase [Actinobacteria bacterium]|nr:DEAD/DEAH box helicase [Actinomycetota bacterium]
MTALLPSLQAERVRRSLVDYLSTTFALADAEPRRALAEFLQDPTEGIFKGPYARLRLPFRPADDSWRDALDWQPPFPPYRHQADAYKRLTSKDLGVDKPRPLPTIVTTGTGSGKTEAFLHPILDHCLRARRRGESGMKALILYPMNALADDQARRLTQLLTTDPALARLTAGLYTGDARDGQPGQGRTKVTEEGLITHRSVLRDDPPDILLTNYKMLDQLLLRPEDQPLWAKSWRSLTYLVLDEFHTYDGAQGTDVAILLRRLGLALRSHVPADHPDRDQYDARPLGRLTPVATSATLGDSSDPTAMLAFAEQVFGEPFTPDAAITERRVDVEAFTAAARGAVPALHERPLASFLAADLADLAAVGEGHAGNRDRLLGEVIGLLYHNDDQRPIPAGIDDETLLRAHSGVRRLVDLADTPTALDDLADELFAPAARTDRAIARRAVAALLAALSIVRLDNRDAVSVDITLWLRELTRIDRFVSAEPGFRWSDDGQDLAGGEVTALPAVFCRACGRSGWGATLAATGRDLSDRDAYIRRDHLAHAGRFRALLHAPGEAAAVAAAASRGDTDPEQAAPNLRWFHAPQRTILPRKPPEDDEDLLDGLVLPVVMLDGEGLDIEKRSRADECPSCGKTDRIRFLGSAIATLLSVSLSTLFGDPDLDAVEKRSLVFTDSVQDAAHRAGFVDHRSHTMSLRTALRRPLNERKSLPDWVEAAMKAAEDDGFARYRLVPADLGDDPAFRPYWAQSPYPRVPQTARTAVRRRLLFDAALEVGLQTSYGRTLEATGSIGVHVYAGRTPDLVAHGRTVLGASEQALLDEGRSISDAAVATWVRGLLENLRRDGAIDHDWLTRYVKEDGNRHWIWGGRNRSQGAPAFPRGRSAPQYALVGGSIDSTKSAFVPVKSPKSWYARWAAKTLGVTPSHGASLCAQLLARLAAAGVLSATKTTSNGTAYGVPAANVRVEPLKDAVLREETTLVVCDTCRSPLPVAPVVSRELLDGPCLTDGCRGTLRHADRDADSFYRQLFTSDMRRVDAREHTSLLDAAERRTIEAGFKRSQQRPGDPNVLVATPTLELGIDIGDLSTVMLSSLPDSVAKYQQRVGRAGRLTGSSLSLAFVTGRGDSLPRLGEPTSLIGGAVRPPATYLDAEEILRRQFLASVIDDMARTGATIVPGTAGHVLASADPGSLLGDLIVRLRENGDALVDRFVATFAETGSPGLAALRTWVRGDGPVDDDGMPQSAEVTICRAVGEHAREVEDLKRRRAEIEAALPELVEAAEHPSAGTDEKRAISTARSGLRLVRALLDELTTQPWIGGLELRGLLPNYSLIDDSVELDAQISWIDPDSGQYAYEPLALTRGSARALTELAPGAYFYARRLQLRVDGAELGQDQGDVHTLAACDTCGYVARLDSPTAASPHSCPRCGGTGIAETGQRFEAARLQRVFSDVRRDDAVIGDNSDERRRTMYELVAAPDFDPARKVGEWSVESVGMGVAHYRRMTVRWLNVGRDAASPHLTRMAGQDVTARMFRLCEACGKLDIGSGANSAQEHRAWCRYRNAPDEHVRALALTRELVTQGVAISLPQSVVTDLNSLTSLSAALRLGLREVMGGAPDHLRVEVAPHPVGDGAGRVRTALFLHDTVPGGTGYLTELAGPTRLWPILVRAAQVLETCSCADEGRASCHRCLAPFGSDVSRVDALRALRALLGVADGRPVADLDSQVCDWHVTDAPVAAGSGESPLEQQFRARLAARLEPYAQVASTPTPHGPRLSVRGVGNRVWHLEPQIDAHGVRPDFVFSTPGGPRIAIFTDGQAFHASQAHNRLADDAIKRERLRAHGYTVLGITHRDLTAPVAPDWLNPAFIEVLMSLHAGAPGSGLSRAAVQEQEGGPLAILDGVLRDPESASRGRLSDALTLLLGAQQNRSTVLPTVANIDLVDLAADQLRGATIEAGQGSSVLVHARPHLVLAAQLAGAGAQRIVLILDDRPDAVAQPDFAEAWQEWLRLSNALAFSTVPTTITTYVAHTTSAGAVASPEPSHLDTALSNGWADVDLDPAYTPPAVVELAEHLAARGVPPAVGGAEIGGIVVDLAWPDARVAVVPGDMPGPDVRELRGAGWTVHLASDDSAALLAAVTSSLPDASQE